MINPDTKLLVPQNIFLLEESVAKKLSTFNSAYAQYLRCSYNGNENQKLINANCPSISKKELDDKYYDVIGTIQQLITAIKNMGPGGKTPQAYEDTYNEILAKYESLLKLRQELDTNLVELYGIGDTRSNFYERELMYASYSKILLTILATSITYMIFVNMRK